MEPVEINGGRFYVRPLHFDERIDDTHALSLIPTNPDTLATEKNLMILPQMARDLWLSDVLYSWAVCEQTSVDLVALALYSPAEDRLELFPSGDPERILPNTDAQLRDKTPADAVIEARGPITRFIDATRSNK
ncbi:MAG: hypothetical protein Q3962_02030 [Corynebacterium sp.]|nr:hypothetical protein [Corynebacterium sp.]